MAVVIAIKKLPDSPNSVQDEWFRFGVLVLFSMAIPGAHLNQSSS